MPAAAVAIRKDRPSYFLPVGLGAAVLLAALGFFSLAGTALAHHLEYTTTRLCNNDWSAVATYVGGGEKRLVLITDVVVNGAAYAANWSNAPNSPGGTPPGTSGVIPYNSYTFTPTPPADGVNDFLWVGVAEGWTIFSRSGISNFAGGSSNWAGTMGLYSWTGSAWSLEGTSTVTEPASPTNCTVTPTSTPTATSTSTATPTATPTTTPTPTATLTPTATETTTATPTLTTTPFIITLTPTSTLPPTITPLATSTPPPTSTPVSTQIAETLGVSSLPRAGSGSSHSSGAWAFFAAAGFFAFVTLLVLARRRSSIR